MASEISRDKGGNQSQQKCRKGVDELKFHFRQLVPVIFTLSDGEKHVAAASVNVVDSSTEKLNAASARAVTKGRPAGGKKGGISFEYKKAVPWADAAELDMPVKEMRHEEVKVSKEMQETAPQKTQNKAIRLAKTPSVVTFTNISFKVYNKAQKMLKLKGELRGAKEMKDEHREQASAKSSLTEELQEVTRLLEEKREQLKKSKEQEKLLEQELETFRQEEKKKEKMTKENLRMLEEENETVKAQLMQCSAQLESSLSKQNASQQVIQELNNELVLQKEALESLQVQLEKAVQKEKQYLQTMVSKEAYEELSRKSIACQDDLTQTLEKLNHTTSETKSLHRTLAQAQERKVQLEDEIIAYEERMKKLNMELKKLQGFQQQSELEVQAFDKKLEEMSNQVLQWQKQHQSDLKMLAAKEEQLRAFQEEMAALKENLLADEKEPACVPQRSTAKDTCRLRRENDQIMSNMEQWAKEQKIANEKLGNKLREQVKYIAKLTGEKDHLHNVMVHLQQENKKLKTEIEEKKLKTGHPRLYTKALGPSTMEPIQRGKVCATLGFRGTTQDVSQRMDITKFVGIPHCSGMSAICLLLLI
ncbi:polyamine-modulated factor 1-binding protein 1 [Leptonychotes weddellii]|uniref:Polyamine-modulated factor 1-binding protein 1 n=1 Tax=Leptonychotes weddellii TaxID=9713 RepID=A0A7F8RKE8_LEPWE|nr:polyamine-modulated factor 1-binding protein 1 [Leptonychotes weddellii]